MKNATTISLFLLALMIFSYARVAASPAIGFDYRNMILDLPNRVTQPLLGGEPDFTDWSAPVNVGAGFNTRAFDGCPSVTAKGHAMFLTSNREAGSGPSNIYVSYRTSFDSPWGPPAPLAAGVNSSSDDTCGVLHEGYLYFSSNRPGAGTCGGYDIYVAQQLHPDNLIEWGPPVNLGCHINGPDIDAAPSLFTDENGTVNLFFQSTRPGGLGIADIYLSQLQPNGVFGTPSNVTELNSPLIDVRMRVRSDGLEIFFESTRAGSMGGSADIYTARRDSTTSAWSQPENLGKTVNSTLIEGGAALSPDFTELYFMSDRPGTFGGQDVWMSRRAWIIR